MTEHDVMPRQTAHEWVRESLRRDILNGLYSPGDPLKQTEIAARLDVSVTPVREAMRDLATEGIVVIDPQRVARVRSLHESEAREVNEIRALLEPLAAALLAVLVLGERLGLAGWIGAALLVSAVVLARPRPGASPTMDHGPRAARGLDHASARAGDDPLE